MALHSCPLRRCRTYDAYVPNKTISLPDDVIPVIDQLGVPFSSWVADQLRRWASTRGGFGLGAQLLVDAGAEGVARPTPEESRRVGERMDRSAPW